MDSPRQSLKVCRGFVLLSCINPLERPSLEGWRPLLLVTQKKIVLLSLDFKSPPLVHLRSPRGHQQSLHSLANMNAYSGLDKGAFLGKDKSTSQCLLCFPTSVCFCVQLSNVFLCLPLAVGTRSLSNTRCPLSKVLGLGNLHRY